MIMNPNSIDFDMAPDKEMFSYHKRIETFKEWPHTDCNCTPEKVIIFSPKNNNRFVISNGDILARSFNILFGSSNFLTNSCIVFSLPH